MIRPATSRDEAAIRVCAEQAYARYVPRIGRLPAPMTADFAAQIRAGAAHVASDALGAVQGFVVFHIQGHDCLLESVAVLPTCAGRGIGTALIKHCENTARGAGCSRVRTDQLDQFQNGQTGAIFLEFAIFLHHFQ